MSDDNAEAKLSALVFQADRHREAVREFGLAGYVTMVERHKRLLALVCQEIRQHCRENGLEVPEGIPADEVD